MSPEQRAFLSLPVHPRVIGEEEVSWILGIPVRKVRYLVKIRELEVLGGNEPGTEKLFATAYVKEKGDDVDWLSKITRKGRRADREANDKRRSRNSETLVAFGKSERPQQWKASAVSGLRNERERTARARENTESKP